jgi:hypothetical protein
MLGRVVLDLRSGMNYSLTIMTHHEALVILESAERRHRLAPSKGGHGHPLTLRCFMSALRINAQPLGYSPKEFLNQWKSIFPGLLKHGYVRVEPQEDCGLDYLTLTSGGRTTLDRWNREGCPSHAQAPNRRHACQAPRLCQKDTAQSPALGSRVVVGGSWMSE